MTWAAAGAAGLGAVSGWLAAGFDLRRARAAAIAIAAVGAVVAESAARAGADAAFTTSTAAIAAGLTRGVIEWQMRRA
jgi:hypothetical protein